MRTNKKGFTIVELLAVLSILVLGALLIVPSVLSSIDRAKEKEYNRLIDTIEDNAETYYLNNIEKYKDISEDNPLYVSIMTLIDGSYLKKGLSNPKTGEIINEKALVKITKDSTGKVESVFTNAYFNTGYLAKQNVSLGDTYAVNTSDVNYTGDMKISVDGNEVNVPYTIPTDKEATYIVTYTITDGNNTVTLLRHIIVS